MRVDWELRGRELKTNLSAVKDLLGIVGEDLVGHAVPNGFGEDNKVSTNFPGVGWESGFAGVEKYWFIPGETQHDAAVGGGSSEPSHGGLKTECRGSSKVQNEADVSQGKEPSVSGGTGTVHDDIGHPFNILVLAFCRILILMIWFGLPVTDAIGTENVLDAVADFDLSSVAEETIGGSATTNVVF
jgi:hypothetical protein